MRPADSTPSASVSEIKDLVERLRLPTGDSALTLLEQALARAASLDDGAAAAELDRAAIGALIGRTTSDADLVRLDVAALAALLKRTTRRAREQAEAWSPRVWDLLDVVRRPAVLRRLPREEVTAWAANILDAVEVSQFTVSRLFRQRCEAYGSKILFQIPDGAAWRRLSWRRTAANVDRIARGLMALDPDRHPQPVGILSENRIEMALIDLACLTSGLVNVLIPGNATEADVGYILRHSKMRTVIVSNAGQLRKVLANLESASEVRHIVTIDTVAGHERGPAIGLGELMARAERVSSEEVRARGDAVRIDDLATVMYTSGTTGTPKGIQFSQRNLVFKRFARALALPEIGHDDVFLCFLPLFHTFGRFLEMLGCVFWGATYCFLDDPSVESLVRGMRQHQPTVFISVPKKWMQLHEAITRDADPLTASDAELLAATRAVTGGRLRWGLSAAGHLSSDVFRFFHQQGIELMSGFGMTEATGGITMTPPGEYKDDSLGVGLPGIELDLAEDGELCVRGPYVMIGYLDPPDGESSFDEEGWLHTGDLMQLDVDGHYRLVDRKKEIYKNIKGETIAPQRIENMFRDFESVARVFLVGDHREYNTLLIYPNHAYAELDFRSLSPREVKDHFRSLVVSVNKFLAPYERIVDFAVIDRDLDPDRGELTPKGTPRRRQVVNNFEPVIRMLYRRTYLQVGGLELILPNWLLQALGLTAQNILVDEDRIVLPHSGAYLTVRRVDESTARIGSDVYSHPPGPWNLGALLTSPRLWLGNDELFDFAALQITERQRSGRTEEGIQWSGRCAPYSARPDDHAALQLALERQTFGLLDVHRAACLLASADSGLARRALAVLEQLLATDDECVTEPARMVLARAAQAADVDVARQAFSILAPVEKPGRFRGTVELFLQHQPELLDADTRAALATKYLPGPKIEALVGLAREACAVSDPASDRRAVALLDLLAEYGAGHPASYRRLRAVLVRMSLFAGQPDVRRQASAAALELQQGFRGWLGPNARIAVDPETGQEYRWDDVVVFDEQVPRTDRARMLSAIKDTALLREASFLFCKGVLVRLEDIPPGGVWIRPLGALHGKSVYRVTMQTRFHGGYDLAINLNHDLSPDRVKEEIQWLIISAESGEQEPLVEEFGGYWPEQDLWSEEFVSGETLARAMRRLAKRADEQERFRTLWPFLAWTALSAYVDFWHRCGGRWEIADPTMNNVVVPTDDYHTGVRIVSVSARREHRGLLDMMRLFMDEFINPAVEQYPQLHDIVGWDLVFSSVLEVIGEDDGLRRFREALQHETAPEDGELHRSLTQYIETVQRRGFLPRRVFFAVKRYRRWEDLSDDPTPQARARTLQELYDTYGLQRLTQDYPEVRLRLFRETVLRDSPQELVDGLEELIARLRDNEQVADELIDAVAELRAKLMLTEEQDYFLARLSLPYLRPEDAADFVRSDLGGKHQTEIVVNLEDDEGNRFRVRHALNPKEVGKLHQLFLAAKVDVRFRPEHRYLVAINDRQQIIAGIYYDIEEGAGTAHLEKIVVSEPYRRKGVADGLMNEFFNRLRAAAVKTVTTGFFRPEYFYAYGFRIEKRYAGLVKSLDEEQVKA